MDTLEYSVSPLVVIELLISIIAWFLAVRLLPWKVFRKEFHNWQTHDLLFFSFHGFIALAQTIMIAEIAIHIHVLRYPQYYAGTALDMRFNRILSPMFEYGAIPSMCLAAFLMLIQIFHKTNKMLKVVEKPAMLEINMEKLTNETYPSTQKVTTAGGMTMGTFYLAHLLAFVIFIGECFPVLSADAIPYPENSGKLFRILCPGICSMIAGSVGGIAETKVMHHSIRSVSQFHPEQDDRALFAAFLKEKVTKKERLRYYIYSIAAGFLGLLSIIFYVLGEYVSPGHRTSFYNTGLSISVFAIVMGGNQSRLLFSCIKRVKKSNIHISPTQMQEAKLKDRSSITPSEANYLVPISTIHAQAGLKESEPGVLTTQANTR